MSIARFVNRIFRAVVKGLNLSAVFTYRSYLFSEPFYRRFELNLSRADEDFKHFDCPISVREKAVIIYHYARTSATSIYAATICTTYHVHHYQDATYGARSFIRARSDIRGRN